jgi:conjugative transposon TraM protein
MKENKKGSILIEEYGQSRSTHLRDKKKSPMERLKKPVILGLMGIVFVGCMYLIFKPSSDKKGIENIGLNDSVPQAADKEMEADKEKAYEQEMLEQKEQQKRKSLMTLSDYWKQDSPSDDETAQLSDEQGQGGPNNDSPPKGNPALNGYRNAQNALGSFYQDDHAETQQLRKQLEELKEKLAEKEVPAPVTVDDQLVLMEKSYQMAAKYLPSGSSNKQMISTDTSARTSSAEKKVPYFAAFTAARKNAVSTLYREGAESSLLVDWNQTQKRGFYRADEVQQTSQPRNSIKACVQETKTIIGESVVHLRLLEDARTPDGIIAKGTILSANAKIQAGRLHLRINSIEIKGNITAVDIMGYDLDGQQGLYVPYSQERTALGEMAGNMSQQTGTSLMMTQSAGQQIAADLSRGVVQGISGYFSKKVKTPKVTLKAGHQLFLVSKK